MLSACSFQGFSFLDAGAPSDPAGLATLHRPPFFPGLPLPFHGECDQAGRALHCRRHQARPPLHPGGRNQPAPVRRPAAHRRTGGRIGQTSPAPVGDFFCSRTKPTHPQWPTPSTNPRGLRSTAEPTPVSGAHDGAITSCNYSAPCLILCGIQRQSDNNQRKVIIWLKAEAVEVKVVAAARAEEAADRATLAVGPAVTPVNRLVEADQMPQPAVSKPERLKAGGQLPAGPFSRLIRGSARLRRAAGIRSGQLAIASNDSSVPPFNPNGTNSRLMSLRNQLPGFAFQMFARRTASTASGVAPAGSPTLQSVGTKANTLACHLPSRWSRRCNNRAPKNVWLSPSPRMSSTAIRSSPIARSLSASSREQPEPLPPKNPSIAPQHLCTARARVKRVFQSSGSSSQRTSSQNLSTRR